MKQKMLPPLQRACLRWVFLGRTPTEIALLEGKSVAEIQINLEDILAVLNVKTLSELMQKE